MKTGSGVVSIILFGFAVVGVPAAIGLFIFNWYMTPIGDRVLPYVLIANHQDWPLLLGLVWFPLAIVLTFILIALRQRAGRFASTFILLVLLIGGNATACLSSLPVIFEEHRTLDRLALRDRVYYLDWSSTVGVGGDERSLLALWQCDSSEWACQVIHREWPDGSDYTAAELRLAENGIEMLLNGAPVFHTER